MARQPLNDRATVVFDLDGTLADTAADLIETMNVLMARENVAPVPVERARDVVGAGARAMIQRGFALGGRSLSQDKLDQLFVDFLDHYAQHLAVKTRLFPGVVEALDLLEAAGHRLAVCTNKVETHSVALLEALGVADRFAAICGRDTFAYAKPDPRHLTGTIEKAGGDPARAIMVGDSRTDIDTARAAGLPVVAVTFGYTDTPVTALAPDVIIDRFDELYDVVRALDPDLAAAVA
ncbi:phosphoglycolate phosphatase [Alsobacter soli]|uniref:Phosphoglycolate phosphatase n=1 Tax=Alsobacter soli TaxID=2109933 RepID=A0A2T1HVU4_9HYPH|nr:phosphoglycolate phosphatase [Alsobacter soli]PSC05738.1 phosphoglycolate phosphatase [Alsobacter soli]